MYMYMLGRKNTVSFRGNNFVHCQSTVVLYRVVQTNWTGLTVHKVIET